ncbi:MAG: hypothetical protein LBT98_00340 [Puniceicoccales bacterium]|jgi:hypothetical protein|nr:hypothetical protein [Puniceicoccales bacterium]
MNNVIRDVARDMATPLMFASGAVTIVALIGAIATGVVAILTLLTVPLALLLAFTCVVVAALIICLISGVIVFTRENKLMLFDGLGIDFSDENLDS